MQQQQQQQHCQGTTRMYNRPYGITALVFLAYHLSDPTFTTKTKVQAFSVPTNPRAKSRRTATTNLLTSTVLRYKNEYTRTPNNLEAVPPPANEVDSSSRGTLDFVIIDKEEENRHSTDNLEKLQVPKQQADKTKDILSCPSKKEIPYFVTVIPSSTTRKTDPSPTTTTTKIASLLNDLVSAAPQPTTTRPTRKRAAAGVVSNRAKTARLMPYWPSITTFTLASGWDDQKTIDLKNAVQEVVRRNPVLSGQAKISGRLTTPAITIYTGAFPPERHEFVREIRVKDEDPAALFLRQEFSPNTTNETNEGDLGWSWNQRRTLAEETKLLHFMDQFLAPLVPPALSVMELIKHQSPLFGVDIVRLPHGYACYVVRLSHCIADGATYYYVMNEINHFFNNHLTDTLKEGNHHHHPPLVPIDWTNPEIATHELWPCRLSEADIQKAYGIPAILGMCRNAVHMNQHQKGYLVLSKEKVKAKQQELNLHHLEDEHHGHVSANDIITAALCQANDSTDIFAFTMNARPKGCHYGFNFHHEVPFDKKAVRDPFAFRNIIKQGYYYDTDQLPLWPFVLGRIGRISSLTSIQKCISSDDVHVLAHSVLGSFVQNIPLDAAFIMSMNKDSYLVLHNFRSLQPERGLLKDILL